MYEFNWAPQGWQCPVCRRVYSPTTPWCYFCGNETYTTSTTTTVEAKDNNVPEWMKWMPQDSTDPIEPVIKKRRLKFKENKNED